MDGMLPEDLKAARKAKRLTQEQIAEICGVTPSCVSRWETGTWRPSPKHQEVLRQVFSPVESQSTETGDIVTETQVIRELVYEMHSLKPEAQEIVLEVARRLKKLQDSE